MRSHVPELKPLLVPRSPLRVRGRRGQYGYTDPESTVPAAVAGIGGAGLGPAGAVAGEGRA